MGGCFTAQSESGEESVFKQDNAAGCGWLPEGGDFRRVSKGAKEAIEARVGKIRALSMPQIERPDKAVKIPYERITPAGFGPLPGWHTERARYAGTYDEKWKTGRYPKGLLPEDFDLRFYQAAPPDQICPVWLNGDEAVELEGMTVEGSLSMRLPGWNLEARIIRSGNRREVERLRLDTVAFDLDTRQALLTWRLALRRDVPLERVVVSPLRGEG